MTLLICGTVTMALIFLVRSARGAAETGKSAQFPKQQTDPTWTLF